MQTRPQKSLNPTGVHVLGAALTNATKFMTGGNEQRAPRCIVGDKVMMPADLKRLHKYMLDVEHIGFISNEMREVVEELWDRA